MRVDHGMQEVRRHSAAAEVMSEGSHRRRLREGHCTHHTDDRRTVVVAVPSKLQAGTRSLVAP